MENASKIPKHNGICVVSEPWALCTVVTAKHGKFNNKIQNWGLKSSSASASSRIRVDVDAFYFVAFHLAERKKNEHKTEMTKIILYLILDRPPTERILHRIAQNIIQIDVRWIFGMYFPSFRKSIEYIWNAGLPSMASVRMMQAQYIWTQPKKQKESIQLFRKIDTNKWNIWIRGIAHFAPFQAFICSPLTSHLLCAMQIWRRNTGAHGKWKFNLCTM